MATLIEPQINRHVHEVNIPKSLKLFVWVIYVDILPNKLARFLSRYLINAFSTFISEAINWSVVVNDKQDDVQGALGDAFKGTFPTFAWWI